MNDLIVKSKWKLSSIEYSGLGDTPYFILTNDQGETKLVPIERGVHNLRSLLDLEEE
tara:strand:+ start:11158 stop:11328 length:171 start_codon:yes stop_codon:yes gene_type:complete